MGVPRIGVVAPRRWTEENRSFEHMASYAREVEARGFDSLWVTDRLLHSSAAVMSPLVFLSFASAHTSRLRLGTAVLLLNLRHPVDVARQAVTLDWLSGGRLTLGVSAGGRQAEFGAMNVSARQRVGRFEESVSILRRLWEGDAATVEGATFHLEEATILPLPVQQGGIPVWIGAGSDAGLKRAGRLGDGWIMGTPGRAPKDFARAWNVVLDGARTANRDATRLHSAKMVYVNLSRGTVKAGLRLEDELRDYYGGAGLPHAIVSGTPQTAADEILAYGEAGCELVLLFCPWDDRGQLELMTELASTVRDSAATS